MPAFKEYYRWWFVNTLLRHSMAQAMPLIADTSMANLLLRALGLLELMTFWLRCAVQKRWWFLLGISLMKTTYDIIYIHMCIYNYMYIFVNTELWICMHVKNTPYHMYTYVSLFYRHFIVIRFICSIHRFWNSFVWGGIRKWEFGFKYLGNSKIMV